MKLKRRRYQIGVGGVRITPLAKRYVNRVLDSGRLTYGPFLRRFETEFARLHKRRFAVSLNSGTSALQVAVHAMKEMYGWKDGDEIIVPALTFIATSNVVIQNNLRPVFVDIDPKTYHLDPAKIEAAVTRRTRAIMPVHVFGVSADMPPILAIARRRKLRVIEDSCEAAFVNHRGEPVGSQGDIACFSTYQAHLATTGVGGILATNDPAIAVKARSLANHGRDSIYIAMDDDRGKRGKALAEVVDRRFSFVSIGYSYQLPSWPDHSEHAFMMFPIVIRDRRIKKSALTRCLETWNIETRDMLPLLNQPVYRRMFGNIEPKYPGAAWVRKNGFYIGCHPGLSRSDLLYTVAVFKEFFRRAGARR